ncbi:MAG: hypothetical protein GWP12_01790 [Nitrospirae bacterium]|nr:hypothetical protein [Nitrospirota bacterium]
MIIPVHAIHLEDGVTIPVVAAYSTKYGESGILLNATVIVTEGDGRVFVDTQPYTQVDLQGSTRIAALVASDITGIDPSKYDFYYIIEITCPLIGGPSAGAALTVATIADIENWPLKKGVVMTGMINPDGSIGPVGGIPYKLDAVAENGATLFIVPEGQTEVVIIETKFDHNGSVIKKEENPITVDIVKRGKKQNVDVVEAINIEDAVELVTGKKIHREIPAKGVWSDEYLDVLRPLSRNVMDEADFLYESVLNETTNRSKIIESQKNQLEKGEEQYNNQEYYAAINTGLWVIKNIKYVKWSEEYQASGDKDAYLKNLFENVSNEVDESGIELDKFKEGGVVDVDNVGAAEIRVVMAERMLEDANDTESIDLFIDTMASASSRAETVTWWLSLANSNHHTSEAVLKSRAGWYLGMSSSVVTYSRTVIGESGGYHGVSFILNDAEEARERARIEFDRGYYSGAIFDSLFATVQASTAISLMGSADIDTKISRSADSARVAIEDSRNVGIEPVLAVSAYEFADSLESPTQKIIEYNYARVVAKTTVQLTEYFNVSAPISNMTPIPLNKPTPITTQGIPGMSILMAIMGFVIVIVVLRR